MSEGQSSRSDPRLTFAATVPLRVPPRFTAMELLMTVCDMLAGTGVVATIDPELSDMVEDADNGSRFWNRPQTPPRAGLTVNGITMQVLGHDRAAFSAAELSRLHFGDWKSGSERLARTRSHVEITEVDTGISSDLDYNYDRAAALTVAAAAVNRLAGAVALVWHTSHQAVPAERIGPMFEALMDGTAPVALWISNPPLPNGAHGAATRGFYSLLGAEIAVLSKKMSAAECGVVAGELAADILRSGEAPSHGERLHYEGGMQFRVEHRAIGVDGGVPVVVLAQVTDEAKHSSSDANGKESGSLNGSAAEVVVDGAPEAPGVEPEDTHSTQGSEPPDNPPEKDEISGDDTPSATASGAV